MKSMVAGSIPANVVPVLRFESVDMASGVGAQSDGFAGKTSKTLVEIDFHGGLAYGRVGQSTTEGTTWQRYYV